MINVKSLKDGDLVEGLLALRSKDGKDEGLRSYRDKPGQFFVIRVGNSNGDITLKYWGGKPSEKTAQLFSSIEAGDVVFVKGRCTHDSYSKELVISVNEEPKYGAPTEFLKKADEGEYRPEDFMPSLPDEAVEALFTELKGFVEGVKNPHLKILLMRFFADAGFVKAFKRSPAARKNHHNYVGGLLEHSVNVARLCSLINEFYPMDRDLLITGALLHDIGKTREYTVKASVDVTSEGMFIGHLSMTAEMIRKEIEALDGFPQTLAHKVIHMILSHHGELEFGSPKEPAFPEALALFHADYMDASVKNTIQEIEGAPEDAAWIYSKSLKRFLHTGIKKP